MYFIKYLDECNDECKVMFKEAKRAFNKYKKHRAPENLIILKKYKAIA